jgi:hypothetical protein
VSGGTPTEELKVSIWYDARVAGGSAVVATLAGKISEHADFAPIEERLAYVRRELRFVLEKVTAINSAGVRRWVELIGRALPETPVILERCSPAVIEYVNLIASLKSRCRVESLFAPYRCERCAADRLELLAVGLDLAAGRAGPPERSCPQCREPMSFDEVADQYFSFLA